jgi:TctA family transporter
MAILLGAFIIQGIVPGPDLLDPAKHLNLTFSFVWIIVVSNIITVAVCLLFLNQLAKITFVKGTFLIPFLLLLIYLGGFAVNNAFGDMVMVLIFGAVGWLMVRFDWQRPPLLLGLVLGGIAENNLFIATKVYGAGFMLRPGVLLITLLIVAGLSYPMFQAYRERKRPSGTKPRSRCPASPRPWKRSHATSAWPMASLPSASLRCSPTFCASVSSASVPTRSAPPCFRWSSGFRPSSSARWSS